jgi:hypothetical protein
MKILLELPRDHELGSVNWDQAKRQLTIEPKFIKAQSKPTANVLFAQVTGTGGRESRSVVSVSGTTGALFVSNVKPVPVRVSFDEPPETSKPEPEPEPESTPSPAQSATPPVGRTPPPEV